MSMQQRSSRRSLLAKSKRPEPNGHKSASLGINVSGRDHYRKSNIVQEEDFIKGGAIGG